MNRRGFLKFLGIGSAAAVTSPSVLAISYRPNAETRPRTYTYLGKAKFDQRLSSEKIWIAGEQRTRLESVLPEEVKSDDRHFQFLNYLKTINERNLGI